MIIDTVFVRFGNSIITSKIRLKRVLKIFLGPAFKTGVLVKKYFLNLCVCFVNLQILFSSPKIGIKCWYESFLGYELYFNHMYNIVLSFKCLYKEQM